MVDKGEILKLGLHGLALGLHLRHYKSGGVTAHLRRYHLLGVGCLLDLIKVQVVS